MVGGWVGCGKVGGWAGWVGNWVGGWGGLGYLFDLLLGELAALFLGFFPVLAHFVAVLACGRGGWVGG